MLVGLHVVTPEQLTKQWRWAIIVILPLLWTLMTSFKTTTEIFASPFNLPVKIQFGNYTDAWTTAGIGTFFFNTIFVVGSALVLVIATALFDRFISQGSADYTNKLLSAMRKLRCSREPSRAEGAEQKE